MGMGPARLLPKHSSWALGRVVVEELKDISVCGTEDLKGTLLRFEEEKVTRSLGRIICR